MTTEERGAATILIGQANQKTTICGGLTERAARYNLYRHIFLGDDLLQL